MNGRLSRGFISRAPLCYHWVMDDYLTKGEACELLRISAATLNRAMRDGRLKYAKVGRRVVLRRPDLDAWIAAQLVKPKRRNS